MRKGSLSLRDAVKKLHKHYGPPVPPPAAGAFELILWENVAYLAPPARRREAWEELKRTVGTKPRDILAAKGETLEHVTARGTLKGTSAAKLRECARTAINEFGGDLDKVIHEPLARAKRALRKFPSIGEPGAEKILLFTGEQALLAPDSNGLRVLVRLGFVPAEKSYARMYAAGREAAKDLGTKPRDMQGAHLLLQQHGQTLCKRNDPLCEECPLAQSCAYAAAEAEARG